ncbi:MAG: N-acetylglucosamine-6-phosphate deacetylase [Flaviaesturariibacter sp.]|nr:N-acetylglucosamine-6-phosphate deacetylase [Flaviaesturariibacter sp.]
MHYFSDRIFDGDKWISGTVSIEGGLITSIRQGRFDGAVDVGGMLVPAFIDIQVYGAAGRLLSAYPEPVSIRLLVDHCRKGGATLIQPTVATNSPEVFRRCIDAVRAYRADGGTGVHGLHLEGPWIAPEKRGAHLEEFIRRPDVSDVTQMLDYGNGVVTMITLAPEVCTPDIIDLVRSRNVVVSAGHSNASFDQATAAFDSGITTATHLYNAMSPLQHRAPGLVGALFLHPTAMASVIVDGYHASFEAVRIACRQMEGRLFAITDAVTDTKEGPYRHVLVGGDRYECNGVLSGSALTMHDTLVNLVRKVGIPLEEALRMSSLLPARALGWGEKQGRIAPGFAAQFCVIGDHLQLIDVLSAA